MGIELARGVYVKMRPDEKGPWPSKGSLLILKEVTVAPVTPYKPCKAADVVAIRR